MNVSVANFRFCLKTPGDPLALAVLLAGSSTLWAPGGARAIPPDAGTRVPGNKDGDLNKKASECNPEFYPEQHACKNS